jgi:hypothetical protein
MGRCETTPDFSNQVALRYNFNAVVAKELVHN